MNEPLSALENTPHSEIPELVKNQLEKLLESNNLEGAKSLLSVVQSVDIAEAIENLPESMQAIAFRLLPKAEAIEVYEHLDTSVQQALIEEFKRQEVIEIVGQMSPDDRARLFDELPAKVVRRLLADMSPQERQNTALLLGYQEDTAGRIMTPEYISLKENMSIGEALQSIKRRAQASELIYYLYVTDTYRHLLGIVSLKNLVLASEESPLSEIITREVISVNTDTDQEEVARLIRRYDLLAIPVVDKEDRLVGVVTVDDVMDIIEQETTEDIYALGGLQSEGDNYFQTNLLAVARKRVVWLFVLLFTNTFTSGIIQSQEDILNQVVALAAFIPLLIGTGGNVGAQSSTVVIRGLSTDEVRSLGLVQVVIREALAGLLLGLILGVVAMGWAYVLRGELNVAIIVGISLVAIAVLASVTGSILPFLFKSLNLDPALMSAPFITTVVDVLGVLIYFSIARLVIAIV
ncbi:MAG: magnesium transporter [Halothece sp.]